MRENELLKKVNPVKGPSVSCPHRPRLWPSAICWCVSTCTKRVVSIERRFGELVIYITQHHLQEGPWEKSHWVSAWEMLDFRLTVSFASTSINLITVPLSLFALVPVPLSPKSHNHSSSFLLGIFSILTSIPGFIVFSWLSNFQLPSLSHLFHMVYSICHCKKPQNPSFGIRQV